MADIRTLELEFAKNSTMDVCIPLVEAYMAANRFMEAMVVCKKGIKVATADPRGPVLLARVYLEQGKLPKAQQELQTAMQQFPGNPFGLELQGRLLMQQGNAQGAAQLFMQALQLNPNLANARAWLAQLGIQAPAAAPPFPPAPQAMPPQGMPAAPPGMRPPMMGVPMQPQMPGGMPGMRPPMMGMPMQPQMPGGGMPPGPPGMPRTTMPPQPMAPMAMPTAAPAMHEAPPPGGLGAPEPMPQAPKEHVSDFFAPDSLGFKSGDLSGIETAGPGRLTILGFVPKSTGSIKTTIAVALGVFAIAGAIITWQVISGNAARQAGEYYKQIREAIDQDKYHRYVEATDLIKKVFEVDDTHDLTLAAATYIYGVLAMDHEFEGAKEKAAQYCKKAREVLAKENAYQVAGCAMVAYLDGKLEQGYAEVKKIQDKGGTDSLIEMEAYRLLSALKPNDPETQKQFARLAQSATTAPRPMVYLGWVAYQQEDWAKADKQFSDTLKNSKAHPVALLGSALTDLSRGIALKERQFEIEKAVKQVFAFSKDELSPPILALAHFVRGQLFTWQGKEKEGIADYEQALKIKENPLFYYARGVLMLNLGKGAEAIDLFRKAAAKEPNSARVLKRMARAQIDGNDLPGAMASLERAKALAAADPDVTLLRGDALVAAKKYKEAIAEYQKINKEHGGAAMADATIGIAQATRESGDKKGATTVIEKFLESAPSMGPPTHAKIWCALGEAYEVLKNKEKAQECFQVGIEQFRYYGDCHYFMAKSVGLRGGEAVEACKLYLTLEPRGKHAAECQKIVPPEPAR